MTLRLIVAAILTERLESAIVFGGKTREMLVDVVAVVVMLLMLGDIARMLFVDDESHRR